MTSEEHLSWLDGFPFKRLDRMTVAELKAELARCVPFQEITCRDVREAHERCRASYKTKSGQDFDRETLCDLDYKFSIALGQQESIGQRVNDCEAALTAALEREERAELLASLTGLRNVLELIEKKL